jgi:predicted GTPase
MSARIEDTHWIVARPVAPNIGSRPGLVDQSASQRPLSSRQKELVSEVGHPEWNGAPDPEKLRAYMNLKLALAEQLRWLMEILKKRGSDALIRRCQELMVKLAEDRFTLAIVGQFKRGKSSLMNAIIGRDLLPVGVLPLTSAITVLKFGPVEQLVIERENSNFADVVPVSELPDYVTERGNPGNCKRVKTARLEVPLPFLRRGLEFVDTPGVGSSIEANTGTTYTFLPECDAVLFVTSVESPFAGVEKDFLRAIREHVRKIFFIVNKTDLLADARERDEIFDFIRSTIREQMGTDTVKIVPVSARVGIAATLAHDAEAFARSGLKDLHETLAEFLADAKASVLLSAIADKALRLIEAETGELELCKKARSLTKTDLRRRLDTLKLQLRQQEAARNEVMAKLRDHLLKHTESVLHTELGSLFLTRRSRVASWIERVTARAGWRLCEPVSRRCADGFIRRLRAETWRWLRHRIERLGFASDERTRELQRQLQSDLSEIPTLAAAAFDLPQKRGPETAGDFPWRIRPEIESPFLANFTWMPCIPEWLRFLPVRLARRSLRALLETDFAAMLTSFQDATLDFVVSRVDDAIGSLAVSVNTRAGEIETRLIAAITGERPPRPAWQQAMPPLAEVGWGDAELDSVRQRLLTIHDGIAPQASEHAAKREMIEQATVMPSKQPPPRVVESDLAKALKTRGCPVCDHLVDVAWNFFADWQYAISTDEKSQEKFAAEHGFCPLYTWQLIGFSSPTGSSVGFAKLVEHTSHLLQQASRSQEGASTFREIVPNAGSCRVCRMLRKVEADFIERLAAFLREPKSAELYSSSQGVCLRHLDLLIRASGSDQIAEFLSNTAARRFEETAEDMRGFAMKRDATRRGLTNDNESDAWMRAITHIAGAKGYCMPRPNDGEI